MSQTAFASTPGADAALTANQEDNVALVPERMNVRREEKMRIAQAALELIEPHDRIIMDASSTTFYLAQLIPSDLPITVLTHSVSIIVELNKKQKTEVIATGGILSKNTMSFIGPLSESTMGMYNVNKAFISCMGVHLEYGVTELSELQALVKRKMIEAADHVILLADHSKFGRKNFTHLCNIDQIDLIITDGRVDRQHLASMESSGIRYCVAP
jgi:DeoR/GlpR family transcriptional regulator of sugar metabolism